MMQQHRQHRPQHGGFTLVELMIVIAIIGLLAAVLLPNIMSARDAAGDAATEAVFLRLETACDTFQRKNGYFPPDNLKSPEAGRQPEWKPDNGQNTGIESFVAFVSQSGGGGSDFSDLGDKLTNTDKDDNGIELPRLHRKDRVEIADAWGTPLAYFTKFSMDKPQSVVGIDGEMMAVSAVRRAGGDYHGMGKFQFVSAGKDHNFGTKDDLVWPKD